MPNTPDSVAPVTAEQFRALLEGSGLSVSEKRAAMVMEEFNAQLALARTFPLMPNDAVDSDPAPFDPTFPTIAVEEDAV